MTIEQQDIPELPRKVTLDNGQTPLWKLNQESFLDRQHAIMLKKSTSQQKH